MSSYLQVIGQPPSLSVNQETEMTDKAQGLSYFAFSPPSKKTENQSEASQGALAGLARVASLEKFNTARKKFN